MLNYQKFLFNEEWTNYAQYLVKINFNEKLCSLAKKYKNKRILIYGNGILFDVINENYDLKKYLNVCAVSDLKYEKEDISEYSGFKTIRPSEIPKLNADVILVSTINPTVIKDFLIKNNFTKKGIIIESIVQLSLKDKFKSEIKRLKSACIYLIQTANLFDALKYSVFLSESELETKNNYLKKIRSLKQEKQRKIRVLFICEENSKWGYQSVYDEMKQDGNFDILPILNLPVITKDRQEYTQEKNIEFFKSFGMDAVDGYDYDNNIFKPLKDYNPDIVFYQQPWYVKNSQLPQEVSKYALTCIVSYGYTSIDTDSWGSDAVRKFSGHLWKMFAESSYHNKFYQKAAKLRFKDILITKGYPKLDNYNLPIDTRFESLWKDGTKQEKYRIIWAPHYSIDEYGLAMSMFKKQYKYFLDLAKKHSEYSFIIKPHPLLRYKCVSENFMTEDEYDKYMEEWNSLPNASVYNDGNYFDIFKTSDVLITDSSSFLGEYFYSTKPIIFFERSSRASFNEFGQKIKNGFYIPSKTEEVEELLEKLLVEKHDNLKEIRKNIILKEYYYPKIGIGKSIVEYLKAEIGR